MSDDIRDVIRPGHLIVGKQAGAPVRVVLAVHDGRHAVVRGVEFGRETRIDWHSLGRYRLTWQGDAS